MSGLMSYLFKMSKTGLVVSNAGFRYLKSKVQRLSNSTRTWSEVKVLKRWIVPAAHHYIFNINSGVPQGSLFRQIIFILVTMASNNGDATLAAVKIKLLTLQQTNLFWTKPNQSIYCFISKTSKVVMEDEIPNFWVCL